MWSSGDHKLATARAPAGLRLQRKAEQPRRGGPLQELPNWSERTGQLQHVHRHTIGRWPIRQRRRPRRRIATKTRRGERAPAATIRRRAHPAA
eukprot:5295976-Alexandrium_andersonii.AAC.1